MTDKTYNGWTNYETWAVALWIDNERGSYEYWREEAKRHRKEAPVCRQVAEEIWTAEQAARFNLADQIKEEMEDGSPIKEASVYADLLGAALGDVDWQEIAANILEELEPEASPAFGPVVFAYSRAQAIADGVLVDVSKLAREAGINYHTAMTSAVWQKYVTVPDGIEAQDEQGRLWDILWMLRCAIQKEKRRDISHIDFQLLVRNDNRQPEQVTLKALCGPGDQAEPVITVMLPDED
jgi:hypothetical protein